MRFQMYAALLPTFGAPDGDKFTAETLDPNLVLTKDMTAPDPPPARPWSVPEGFQTNLQWTPLANVGPNRIAFVNEPMLWYAGDSTDRGGPVASPTYHWQFDGGNDRYGVRVAYTFASTGTHKVLCYVTSGATGRTGTAERYVKVLSRTATPEITVVGVGPVKSAAGGWTATLDLVGNTNDVVDWARIVLYVADYWGDPAAGIQGSTMVGGDTFEVEDTIGLDPGWVGGGGTLNGRYDAHIFFNGLVVGGSVSASPTGDRVQCQIATPEVLLKASAIFATPFNSYQERLSLVPGTGGAPATGVPKRGYYVGDPETGWGGVLTIQDVVYQMIAGETNWTRYNDMNLFTAESPQINPHLAIQISGDRWQSLVAALWAEWAVMYCTRKGQLVVRIHPNMLEPGGNSGAYLQPGEPILLLDRSVLLGLSVTQAATNRVGYVKMIGDSDEAKQYAWATYRQEDGQFISWSTLPPLPDNGRWERVEHVRTGVDPVVTWDAPLRIWAKRYYLWKNAQYPQVIATCGLLHILEPYDVMAIAYVSDT